MKLSILLAAALTTTLECFGQAAAHQRLDRLIDHWRWKQYWEGTTELQEMYIAGRQFQALLFWRTSEAPPSVGFCSAELGVCQFYPNDPGNEHSFARKISDDDPLAAFHNFLMDSIGEHKTTDYSTATVTITLPSLDPPSAIRDKTSQPRAEVDSLILSLSCPLDQPGCKFHLMIPFYSHSDPNVPVFRQCSACPNPKPMIIFMKLVQGHWWHGTMDFNASPDEVARTRKQIEKGLMLEVSR